MKGGAVVDTSTQQHPVLATSHHSPSLCRPGFPSSPRSLGFSAFSGEGTEEDGVDGRDSPARTLRDLHETFS